MPFAARRHLRPGKKREVGAGMTVGVGVEKMISAGIVLVHTPLHQSHAENTCVKIQVLLRRSGDGGDVMEPVDRVHRANNRAGSVRALLQMRAGSLALVTPPIR